MWEREGRMKGDGAEGVADVRMRESGVDRLESGLRSWCPLISSAIGEAPKRGGEGSGWLDASGVSLIGDETSKDVHGAAQQPNRSSTRKNAAGDASTVEERPTTPRVTMRHARSIGPGGVLGAAARLLLRRQTHTHAGHALSPSVASSSFGRRVQAKWKRRPMVGRPTCFACSE